jgi:organic radical activating enzyme
MVEYHISDTFYSIQGEGVWTGTPMFFIRLAGCNVNCAWCDTDYNIHCQKTEQELVQEAKQYKTKRVVITGGEPMLQMVEALVTELHKEGFKVHLETNGTVPVPADCFDWVAVSPKSPLHKLSPAAFSSADEIKFVCGFVDVWEWYIEEVLSRFCPTFYTTITTPRKWLIPLAKPYPQKDFFGINKNYAEDAIEYCKQHPDFSLCVQIHKYLNIK